MSVSVEAVSKTVVWKNRTLQGYCCALVKTGLQMIEELCFGTDDIPEKCQLSDADYHLQGIAVTMLLRAGIIRNYYGTHQDQDIFGGRRKSRRESRRGAWIQLYQLISVALAEEFLRRNKTDFEPIQEELKLY